MTLGAIAAAGLIGVGTRFERKSAGRLEPVAFDTGRLEISLGESMGSAVVDGVVKKPLDGLRLRLPQCGRPAFVVPVPILSVTGPQVLDRTYGLPTYRSTDVYRGHIRDGFSHLSKVASYVAARAAALRSGSTIGDDYYVRAYVPSDCAVSTDVYLEWAATVLKLGRNVAGADEASKTAAAH
jgi:hypothetical protein